ncbi:MAG: response regulator [Clostridiales bacterium]|jgi:CheY-like chemotaxis protein|nr:response regulator [Clostridiales bacterium]
MTERDAAMQNVMIVTEVKSFFPLSIKEKLLNLNYTIHIVSADTDAINGVAAPLSAVIIYADDKLVRESLSLNFLKDRAIAEDVPIFVIGELDELKSIKNVIPKEHIHKEFLRPVSINDLAETVHTSIRQFSQDIRKKILVVDDSGAALRSAKEWLEGKYSVYLANSGTIAIKYLTLNRPDLVLLDYEMPVVDGRRFIEMIRSEPEFADVPVIFLTGKEDKERFMMVQAFKPDGYLLKTMPPGQIIKAVDDFFLKKKWNL